MFPSSLCQTIIDVFAECTTTDSCRGKLCAGSAKLVPQKTHSLTALDLLWGKSDIPGLGLRKGEPPAGAPGMAALAVNRVCQGALCAGQDAPSPTEHRMRLGLGAGEGFCWEDL